MTLVKICGITNAADALAAVAAGADALGFNFWPRSPRFVPEAERLDLLRSVPAGVLKVGVFVDTPAAEMDRIAEELGLDAVQLHGALDGDPRTPLWQAVSAGTPGWRETMESSKAAAFLLDTPSGAERGGTGRTFDWALLDGITQRIVLAGGLGPGNVAAAIERVRPWGVDACSRLESAPGKKDASKVRDFIEAVRKTATMSTPTQLPDARGHFGPYGGRYVPETLMAPLEELEKAYLDAQKDPAFQSELKDLLANYAGRPTPLYEAKRLTEQLGGARIFIKREDLLHTGAHKINNALGQALLARRMGKKRVIAETGAGQHGVATATVCALFGLNCTVYMGEEDMRRQRLNVFRMRLLGANVVGVNNGSRTLKDAISEAMRDWVTNVDSTYYLLGSALGAHPYPMMVRDFHRCMGDEARAQILERTGALPGSVFACVGGGSNAIGIFAAFIGDASVKLIGIEAGGRGLGIGEHAARFSGGAPGVLHGAYSYLLQDAEGQVSLTHSISAGLDYALIGPEHAYLHDQGRADYVSIKDGEALEAAKTLARTEGIIPALESSHAVAEALKRAPAAKGEIFLINLSGRGDKDTDIYRENLPELDTPVA